MGRPHDKFHHHCDCQIVPSWGIKNLQVAGYHPEEMYARYAAAKNAVEEVGLDGDDHELVAQTMRRMFPDQYKDGTRIALGEVRKEGATKDGSLPYRKWDRHRNSVIERYNADVRIWLRGGKVPPRNPVEAPKDWPEDWPLLDAKALNHILYSEKNSKGVVKGGHLAGYGWISKPPRTEFPEDWTPEDVISAAKEMVAGVMSRKDGKRTGSFEGTVNGVRMMIVIYEGKDVQSRIITMFRFSKDRRSGGFNTA